MSYQLGDGETTTDPVVARLDELLERQKAEERSRKLALMFTIGGALFAFVRLGIIAIPAMRARSAIGTAPSVNPARRRRRRRRS